MKKITAVFLSVAILLSMLGILTMAEVAYGTKGYPLVNNADSSPVVVNGDSVTFPDGLQIKDSAKFNGSLGTVTTNGTTAAYSEAIGTYYGDTAGSLAVTVDSFPYSLDSKSYGHAQFRDNSKIVQIASADAANASFAFWINAPAEMYVRVMLFSFGYGGSDNTERNFYSSEIRVQAGANIVEIPLADFTVNSAGAVDLTQDIKIFASRFCFRSVENGEDIAGKTVYLDNLGAYSSKNALSDYVTPYGTQGYPLVENANAATIVVNDATATYPDGMQIKDNAKFTGSVNTSKVSSSNTTFAYSDAAGSYYGDTAGSLAATINSCPSNLAGKSYATIQLKESFVNVASTDAANSSFAFWINAPVEMYVRVLLFSYGYTGDTAVREFYSSEIKVNAGVSLVEIPFADFTVNSASSVDLTQTIKLYTSRFHFRSVENGEDIIGKTVYLDNFGVYYNMNTYADYVTPYGTKGYPLVENNNAATVVVNDATATFPDGMQIKDNAKFTGSVNTSKVSSSNTTFAYSDAAGSYYGDTAGSLAATINSCPANLAGKSYATIQLKESFVNVASTDVANSSFAFWINAPVEMYVRVLLFSYGYTGDTAVREFYSSEIKVNAGVSLVEIPFADFTVNSASSVDLTQTIKLYTSRFHLRSVEDGEDIVGKTVYLDNFGVYYNMNTYADYVTPYGTKGYPVVENTNNQPIVVVQDGSKDFPEGINIKDVSKFTGTATDISGNSNSVDVSYSDVAGTYYGTDSGSFAAKIKTFPLSIENAYYSAMQYGNPSSPFGKVLSDDIADSSVAFWINAPEKMNLRVKLFAYRHNGDSGDINFYSQEITVEQGVSFVEIPISNFIVSSDNSIDPTKDLSFYAIRFHFRKADGGEDITDKSVYVDNIGFYNEMNTANDYIRVVNNEYGTKGNPVVESTNNQPIVVVQDGNKDFPEGLNIKDAATFTGSIADVVANSNSTVVGYSDTTGTYYGTLAGSIAAQVKTFTLNIEGSYYSAMQFGNQFGKVTADKVADSSVAFWVNAPEKMNLRVWLFAYRHSGDTGDINFYSQEITVEQGVSFVEIPLANFIVASNNSIDATKDLTFYAARFHFRNADGGEDITDKTVYVDNIGFYNEMNTANDYIKVVNNEPGTKGNPVVENTNNQPIVVIQDGNKVFPDGLNSKDFAKFTGDATYISGSSESAVVSYSDVAGTYYGSAAGSVAAQVKNFAARIEGNYYSAIQFGNPSSPFGKVAADNVADSSVAFWVNAPEKMNLRVWLFAYRHSGDSGDINFYSQEILVEQGVSFVEIPLANFIVASNNSIDATKDLSFYAVRFHFRNADGGEDLTDKTVFVDNIGFYDEMNIADDYVFVPKPEVPEPSVEGSETHKDNAYVENSAYNITEGTVSSYAPVHTSSSSLLQSYACEPVAQSDFFIGYEPTWNFDGEDLGWQPHTSWPFEVSSSSDKAYSGSSMKLTFNKGEATYTSPRVICGKYTVTVAGNDGIAVWVYSEKDVTLTCLGIMNNCGKTNQLSVTVKAGGQIVLFPFSEFANYAAFKGETKTITQLQFSATNVEDGTTIYLDNVGFYKNSDMSPVNENAYGGVGQSIKIATVGGQKTIADKVNRVDIDFRSYLTDLQGNKWEKEATLAIWIKTNRAFKVRVGAGASTRWNPATGENHWFSDYHTVPAGESILRIPLSEFVNKVNWTYTTDTPDWSEYIGRLILQIATLNDVELEMYVDQIAVEYPVVETPTYPAYLDDDSYVWWNFDKDDTVEDLGGDWEPHWAGETGEGVKIQINKNPENSYKGEGNSLQVDYDTSFAEWGSPTVWHEKEMTVYGDGITFWLKSPEKMSVSVVMIAITNENKWVAIQKTDIPVEVGENVITAKFKDFVVSGNAEEKLPEFSRVVQYQIRFKNGTFGTAYIDSIGFSNVVDDGSNEYKAMNPPASYEDFEEGVSIIGEGFENRKDDDLDFCTDWYYEDTGWITLEKIDGNTMLRMDYDMTVKTSVLKSVQYYDNVDPNGGISFYLKSSENRKFGLLLTLGTDIVKIVIDGATEGRYYKIPFSAFWNNKNIKQNYEATSSDLITVKKLELYTDGNYNPPSVGASKKCSIWLDDIKFVDSLGYKRSYDIDYSDNGIRIIASEEAFASGVTPKITVVNLTQAQKDEYISKMRNVTSIYKEVNIKALSSKGLDLIPQRQIELVFDAPEGVELDNVSVWQKYFDGTVFKLNTRVGDDNKIHLLTYRLGNFVIAYGSGETIDSDDTVSDNSSIFDNTDSSDVNISDSSDVGNTDNSDVNNTDSSDVGNSDSSDTENSDSSNTDTSSNEQSSTNETSMPLPIVWIVIGGSLAVICAGIALFVYLKMRRAKNGK